jgi:hypothetical protein
MEMGLSRKKKKNKKVNLGGPVSPRKTHGSVNRNMLKRETRKGKTRINRTLKVHKSKD